MKEYSILIENLNFAYQKNRPILKNLNLHVPKGSIYGFLGPNGAGKSTTMSLISGLYPDISETVHVFGKPISQQIPEIFHRIGALVESPTLYGHLSGEDNLKYIATIRNLNFLKIDEILKEVDLLHAKKIKVKRYSLGMKQRLAIAMCLIHEPELLLLDEPVNGLDPEGTLEIRELLMAINHQRGVTIFISSHLLSEIEKMCSHLGIIAKGEIRFEGTIENLSQKFKSFEIEIETKMSDPQILWVQSNFSETQTITHEKISLALSNREQIPVITKTLVEQGIPIYAIKNKGGLEEWFIDLTKH